MFPSPYDFHLIKKKIAMNTIILKESVIESQSGIYYQVRVPLNSTYILSKIKNNFGIIGNKSITGTWPKRCEIFFTSQDPPPHHTPHLSRAVIAVYILAFYEDHIILKPGAAFILDTLLTFISQHPLSSWNVFWHTS